MAAGRRSPSEIVRETAAPATVATPTHLDAPLPPLGDDVLIVSGLPRSGTSMLMQMLDAGGMPILTDKLREADEDNPKGYFELEAVKAMFRDQSWLTEARGKALKVVVPLVCNLPPGCNYRVAPDRTRLQRDPRVASENDRAARRIDRRHARSP